MSAEYFDASLQILNVEHIPALIRGEQQWAVRRAKVPYIAGTDTKAKSNNPSTWRTFDQAVKAVEAGRGDGLYYALRTDSGIVGIDLDHCVTNGVIDPWAMVYVRLLNSYTCISASGTGLRILAKGAKTSTDCKRGPTECYDHDRFLSITDQHVPGTPETIEERQDELAAFMRLAFPPRPKPEPKMSTAKPTTDLSSDKLFEAAQRDTKFARLHGGDLAGYASPSEARMGYLWKAAFYTRKDATLMDTWFRASSLDQAKWDSKRGVGTLGSFEIGKAIDGCSDTYDPDNGIDLAEGLAAVKAAEEIANSAGCCGGCACDCCTKRCPQLERAYAQAREHVSAMTTIRKATGLSGKHKSVADALLLKVEDARRRGLSEVKIFYGDRTARKEGRDPGGLARDGGTSPSTVGTLVEELRNHDASPYEFQTIMGENKLPRVVVKFDPASTMAADAAAIAALKREKPQHGGHRLACPDHPTAPLIRTTACAECGQIVDQETLRVDPESTGSKLLQALAATTARQRDERVSKVATSEATVTHEEEDSPPPLQHHATRVPDDVGFTPTEGDRPPMMVRELLALGGRLGFPVIVVGGKFWKGRGDWERLADPSMLSYLPEAMQKAEYMAAQWGQPSGATP